MSTAYVTSLRHHSAPPELTNEELYSMAIHLPDNGLYYYGYLTLYLNISVLISQNRLALTYRISVDVLMLARVSGIG
jgi:hypothetical protein